MDASELRPKKRSSFWRHGSCVVIAAVVGFAWVVGLPFQIDDYQELPHYAAASGEAPPVGSTEGPAVLRPALADALNPAPPHLFRPVVWATWALEGRVSGPVLDPRRFHGVSLAFHAVTMLALLALLRRFLTPEAALWGALLASLFPGGAQAVSFVSARGDVLQVLLALVALLLLRGQRRSASVLAAGVVSGAVVLCKITAFAWLPILLVAVAGGRGRCRASRVRAVALWGIPVAGAIGWRQVSLGTWSLRWAGGTQASVAGLVESFRDLPGLLRRALVPWNDDPLMDGLGPAVRWVAESLGVPDPRSVALSLLLLLPGTALLLAPRYFVPRAGAALAVLGVLALPPLVVFAFNEQNYWSRALYPLTPALAFVGGAAFAGLTAWPRLRRGLALVALVVVVDGLVHVARTERRVGAWSRACLTTVDAASTPPDAATVCAIAVPFTVAGIPYLGHALPLALAPPFVSRPRPVVYAPSAALLVESGWLGTHPGRLRLFAADPAGGLVEAGPALPALPAATPFVAASDLGPAREFALAGAPPARALRHLEVRVGPGATFALDLRLAGVERRVVLEESATPRVLVVDLELGWDALREPAVPSLALAASPSWAGALELSFPGELPSLELVAPPVGARIRAGTVPPFRLGGVPAGVALRLSFQAVLKDGSRWDLVYRIPREETLRGADGAVTAVPSLRWRDAAAHPALGWDRFAEVFARELAPRGIASLRLRWRAEALSGDRVRARSPWTWLEVVH